MRYNIIYRSADGHHLYHDPGDDFTLFDAAIAEAKRGLRELASTPYSEAIITPTTGDDSDESNTVTIWLATPPDTTFEFDGMPEDAWRAARELEDA